MQIQIPQSESFVAIGALLLNILALVWGASKLANKLENLTEAFKDHVTKVDVIKSEQIEDQIKIAVLWDGRERRSINRDL